MAIRPDQFVNGGAPEGVTPRAASLAERLSLAVFNRDSTRLDAKENAFLTHLQAEYRRYCKAVARAARLMQPGKTKLHSAEYATIDEWFFSRIPASVVMQGIVQCTRHAKTAGTVIYSVRYARPAIQAEYQRYTRLMVGSHVLTDPWGLHEFLSR